jgi:hypothetical protein
MNPRRVRPPRSTLIAGAAVLVPLIPIIVALMIGAGTGPTSAAASAGNAVLHLQPVDRPIPPAPPNLLLPAGNGALVAALLHATALRATPGGRVVARLATRTPFGSPQELSVARLSGPWLGVITPQTPNNRLGWIPAADASLSRVSWQLDVSLAARTLTVLHDGRAVQRYLVAIGRPSAPTPTGRFAVTDRLLTGDPSGPYGCCILALSANAPHAIQGWTGGTRIAIHSTPQTSTIGHAVSHGCMRLTLAQGRWLLDHIPLGTPAVISSA